MKKNFLLILCSLLFVFSASAQQSIFADDYAPGITFTPFGGSVNTLSIDPSTFHSGTASLKIPVTSGYTGGALMAAVGQNLSAYNAVTFWAKNDNAAFKLDGVGFGDDVTSKVYAVERNGVTLSTTWTKYYIPIPVPSILTAEKSLFHFAEGSGEGSYNIWVDDIQLENVGGGVIGTPTATFTTETQSKEVGQTFGANGHQSSYPVNGVSQVMQTAKPYFTWTSSNTSVATFDALGTGSALAVGSTNVTAKLGLVNATGVLTVNVTPQANPTTPAPTPTRLATDVKSLFSNAYTNIAVESWSTGWSSSNHSYSELQIAGNDTKKYELYHFAGVEFIGAPVDATVYGFMHIDILCPQAGKSLQIRLVDFNAPNSEATVTKATTQNVWVSYDIPITDFASLNNKSKISQILFLVDPGQTGTFFIDNAYFYKATSGGGAGLTVAAPTPPVRVPADVVSIFSGAYTDVAGTDFFPNWGQSTVVSDTTVAGNLTKKYATLNYQGIQFASPVDASAMTKLHIDLWTPNCTAFDVSLINTSPATVEQKVTLTPTLSGWNSFDINLSQYTNIALNNIGQFKLEGTPSGSSIVYLDNIYFYKPAGGGGTGLTVAAPTPPVRLPANVISIFSGAYTDLAATDFNPNWGQSTVVSDTTVAGNLTKKYANFNYQGMQFANPIDASAMTKLHIDIWSANATGVKVFPIVSGQPEQQVTLTIAAGWNSFDIDLTQYTIPLSSIIQIKMESIPFGGTDIYFDNLYFYKPAAAAGLTVAAPTPPVTLPADVVSVFSGAYTDVAGTDFFPNWGQSTVVSDTTVAGNVTKKYANINYQGIQFASPLNVAAMTTLHLDLWTPNCTSFDVFLINTTAPAVEQKVTLTPTLSGWNSFDITLSQYNLIALNNVGQFKLEGRPSGSTVYLDNIYFYKSTSPAVSITSPATNASFTAPATVPITATATANNSGTITKVEFFVDAIKVGEDLTSPYAFTATNVLGGTHALTAVATDNDLQTTTSAAVSINVDGPSGDGYCGEAFSGDYKYRAETDGAGIVTFTMHPLAPIDGSLYAIINIKEGSGSFAGYNVTSIGPDFTFSKAIANGTAIQFYYTYQVPSGGERNSSLNPHSYTVGSNCTGVTGIPTVSILTPADNASYTEPASISFTTTAADNDGTVSKVDFFAGRNLIGTDNTAPFSFDWTNVPAGNYTIAARVTDNANLTTYSKLIRVTVGIDNSVGFCGTVPNGDYSYRAETVGGNVIFTFHPLAPIAGCNNSIIYINGAGTTMTPVGTDFRYTQAFANGTPLSIYFTYNTPLEGGERNSSATPHSYTVGTVCTPVLPVTLLSFTAARQANGIVAINWSTAAEFNNDHYLVERSIDGRSFATIAKVGANTNAALTSNYSAIDRSPVFGLNYYRLTQVDKDGKKTVYAVKIVNIKKTIGGISVYPNPVKGNIINIKVADVTDSRLNVQLISMDGKVIYSGTNLQRGDALQVKLNTIPTTGVYLLKVGIYAPIKIIIN